MQLDSKEIQDIAHLARLEINELEVTDYQTSLSQIISLVSKMQAVDTEGVPPLAHPFDISQRLRADEVTEINQRDKLQSIAPSVEVGFFKVPKVIE